MNNWGYLILIAALGVLAVAMLYARFASRSSGKSLHHAPVDLLFSSETISAAFPRELGVPVIEMPPIAEQEPEVRMGRASTDAVVLDESTAGTANRESDYLDELQEAAAGLAMLMRSSPVGRSEPMVFEPSEARSGIGGSVGDAAPESGDFTEVTSTKTGLATDFIIRESVAADGPMEGDADYSEGELTSGGDEGVAAVGGGSDESGKNLPPDMSVLSVREILGEEISDRIDQIDEGLDVLESLVCSIESSLRELESGVLENEAADRLEGEGESVPAAA